MVWKHWPHWLKGGLIFLIVIITLYLYGSLGGSDKFCFPEDCKGEHLPQADSVSGIVTFVLTPFNYLESILPIEIVSNSLVAIIGFVIVILYLFCIGALIGFIYGKIKSKKQ